MPHKVRRAFEHFGRPAQFFTPREKNLERHMRRGATRDRRLRRNERQQRFDLALDAAQLAAQLAGVVEHLTHRLRLGTRAQVGRQVLIRARIDEDRPSVSGSRRESRARRRFRRGRDRRSGMA